MCDHFLKLLCFSTQVDKFTKFLEIDSLFGDLSVNNLNFLPHAL